MRRYHRAHNTISNVTIISDGTSQGTRVEVGDTVLRGVCKIEIEPIRPDGIVRAELTVNMAALKLKLAEADIECTDPLTEKRIKDVLLEYKKEAESVS